jgi:hypothetical protein
VGKSTNLSKICYWLLQNDFSVCIAACDTFRAGAVEQLKVRVRTVSGRLAVTRGKLACLHAWEAHVYACVGSDVYACVDKRTYFCV